MKIKGYRKLDEIELGKKLNLLKKELMKEKVEAKRLGAGPEMDSNPKRVLQIRKEIARINHVLNEMK